MSFPPEFEQDNDPKDNPIVRQFDAEAGFLHEIELIYNATPPNEELDARVLKDRFYVWREEAGHTDDISLESFLQTVQWISNIDTSGFAEDLKGVVYTMVAMCDQLETVLTSAIELDQENRTD